MTDSSDKSYTLARRWADERQLEIDFEFGGRWKKSDVIQAFEAGYEAEKQASEKRVKVLEDALVSIAEYWNRDRNETAMHDACWHAINTALDALKGEEA